MQYLCGFFFMFENGERYCHVVNKDTGEPLYYPNLYITTQVRNRSESILNNEGYRWEHFIVISILYEKKYQY